MINITIHQHYPDFNSEIMNFCSLLVQRNESPFKATQSIKTYINSTNLGRRFYKFEIQEINKCLLIYSGLDHLLTIKFEL